MLMRRCQKWVTTVLMAAFGILPLLTCNAGAAIIGLEGQTTFNFTAKADHISTGDGNNVLIWGLANETGRAQYPAPTMIVNQGETITVNLSNMLPEATSLVFPGHQVTATGGVAGSLTNEVPADSGASTVSYTFTVTEPGTYTYYSGSNPALQIDMGIVGALIVRPSGFDPVSNKTAYGDPSSAYDHEVLFLLTDMDIRYHELIDAGRGAEVDTSDHHAVYWFINGRNGPDTILGNNVAWLPTQPYNSLPRINPGGRMLIRFIGGGRDPHPLHTHGNNFLQIAKDGRVLSSTATKVADLSVSDYTLSVWPGETHDAIWTWTGERMGWDMYGSSLDADPNFHDCVDAFDNVTGEAGADGYADLTSTYPWEWCEDHDKVMPVTLPGIQELTVSPFYSGSPYLGGSETLPPGEGGFNLNGGFYYMWHSHNEKELTNDNIFPGGMLTFMIIEPPGVAIQ